MGFKKMTFKFEFLSVILFLIITIKINAQTLNNKVAQKSSPNSNLQIGNGNIHKSATKIDKRKTYLTTNNTEYNDNFSGQLITGDNPYITINNIVPDKDSIKYEFELKKKNLRIRLANLMLEGDSLKNRCSLDTNFLHLKKDFIKWESKVVNYLNHSLDRGYAIQFAIAESTATYAMTINNKETEFIDLWRKIFDKVEKLDSFINSLY